MKFIKFSKSYEGLMEIKKSFFEENKFNLKNSLKINSKYSKQPKRTQCKNCGGKLGKKIFSQFNIDYTVCKFCGHLNGVYQDTENFVNWLYSRNEGKNYKKNYLKDFEKRVNTIYNPKVKFLQSVIKKKKIVLDIGSGAGHFLKALENQKIEAMGYEPNKDLVRLGNTKLTENKILNSSLNTTYKIVRESTNFNVLSMIGVLEHLRAPNEMITQFSKSKIDYLYISVPLFSLSTHFENSFSKVFPRQLGGGHTHLYTKTSLEHLAKSNNLIVVGEWWFGTDFPDLFRSLINTSKNYDKRIYTDLLKKNFFSVINELQTILDKNKICSEVHMIFKKK